MTTPDLAGLCERLREQAAYDRQHYPPAHPLFTEAAAAIVRLVAALASLVDRDLTYDGPCIVIPTKNHGEAISLIASARTALEGASDDR